jgi:ABC-type multidrug transport system fused ATPase/permease subunit
MNDAMYDEEVNYIYWSVFLIFMYIVLFAFITLLVQNYFKRKEYLADFEKYRCRPRFMLFASLINPNVNVANNFSYCLRNMITPKLKKETDETLTSQAKNLGDLVNENSKSSDALRKETRMVQEDTRNKMSAIEKTVERVENVSFYFVLKVQNFFNKIGATIVSCYYQLIASINMVLIAIASVHRMIVINQLHAIILYTFHSISPLLFPTFPYMATAQGLTAVNTVLTGFKKNAEKRRFCNKIKKK